MKMIMVSFALVIILICSVFISHIPMDFVLQHSLIFVETFAVYLSYLMFLSHLYFAASSLRLDSSLGDEVDKLAINELFEVLATLHWGEIDFFCCFSALEMKVKALDPFLCRLH